MTSGRIQFANANNIPAINRFLILLFDKHNEKADIANARNGISVPAGSTAMIFEYVKQNKINMIITIFERTPEFDKYFKLKYWFSILVMLITVFIMLSILVFIGLV